MKEFDFDKKQFEKEIPMHGYFMRQKAKSIIKNTKKNSLCLDLGCGSGEMETLIHTHFKKIIGIDPTPSQIKIAKNKKITNCEFFVDSATNLAFKENTFDYVLIINVLHHIKPKDYKKVITEAKRVLKPNGKFLIYEHNPLHPLVWLRFYHFSEIDKGAKMLNPYSLKKLCKKYFSRSKVKYLFSEALGEYYMICEK